MSNLKKAILLLLSILIGTFLFFIVPFLIGLIGSGPYTLWTLRNIIVYWGVGVGRILVGFGILLFLSLLINMIYFGLVKRVKIKWI